MQTASLPATTVQVSADAAINNAPVAPNNQLLTMEPLSLTAEAAKVENTEPSMLVKLSLAFNALLVAAIAALLFGRRKKSSVMQAVSKAKESALLNLKQQLKAIEIQAKQNNLRGMRDAILSWGQCLFAETPPTTLKELAELLDDAELQQQFAQLDRQLYKGETDNELLDITELLKFLKQQSTFSRSTKVSRGIGLKPLYPDQ